MKNSELIVLTTLLVLVLMYGFKLLLFGNCYIQYIYSCSIVGRLPKKYRVNYKQSFFFGRILQSILNKNYK